MKTKEAELLQEIIYAVADLIDATRDLRHDDKLAYDKHRDKACKAILKANDLLGGLRGSRMIKDKNHQNLEPGGNA